MNDPIHQPSHYTSHPSGIEVIEITKHETFLRGNIVKYVLRAPYKGTELQDLEKARQYLDWEIDRVRAAELSKPKPKAAGGYIPLDNPTGFTHFSTPQLQTGMTLMNSTKQNRAAA
jgi:hypothetical protein